MEDGAKLLDSLSKARKELLASFGVKDGDGMPTVIHDGRDYYWVHKDNEAILSTSKDELLAAMHIGSFRGRGDNTKFVPQSELYRNGNYYLLSSNFLGQTELMILSHVKRLYIHLSEKKEL